MLHNRAKYIMGFLSIFILPLSACSKPDRLRVKDAVVILSPVDSNPSALYLNIHGGQKDVQLRSILSPSAIRTEIHKSGKDESTGVMSMEKLSEVNIPAGEKVEFKRGGYHGMVWGVNLIGRRTAEMEIQLAFSNGSRILVIAKVQELDGSIPDERKALGL